MMTAGCGIMGMGSKSWIEKQVSDIEKVYPTENPEDLFEKFPIGFTIYQSRIIEENGKTYSIRLEMKGNKDTKKIEGKVSKVLVESKPYKETIVKESKVEYIKDKGLVLEKSELTTELLPKNYFLFQKLKLNKDILKKLEVKENDYLSIRPEVGTELAYKHYFGTKSLTASVGLAYENELGRVANGKNKARVAGTTADWFNIRGEKEDRKGNVKVDLNIGLDNQRFGVTGNVGYDTKGSNVRGGVGLRVIF